MLVAKPVIENEFWIVQQDNRKIGNVEACADGYQVRINNQIAQYKTISMVEERFKIRFERVTSPPTKLDMSLVHGYPAQGRVHNPVWDVRHRLPIYTKTNKSKSWFAAGWYSVKKGRAWKTVQDPKLIVLERYPYRGPFYTKDLANDQSI